MTRLHSCLVDVAAIVIVGLMAVFFFVSAEADWSISSM